MTEQPANGNGTTALARLLNSLNLPTLAVILLTNGGNWFAIREDGRLTRAESERVIRQIAELHDSLDDFERRQKETLERQGQAIANQTVMLHNQQQILSELHRQTQNFRNPE